MGGSFPIGGQLATGLQSLQSPEMMEQQVPGGEQDAGSPDHCGTCRFFSPTSSQCLRYPPHGAEWSQVAEDQWCGEFQQGEPHMPHIDVNAPPEGDQGTTEGSSFA